MSTFHFRQPFVLVYHGVASVDDRDDPKHLIVSTQRFVSHIRLLQCCGYRFLTAEELLDVSVAKHRAAVLTFDDGWLSWLTDVVSILRQIGVRATFYVCPGLWGTQHPDVVGDAGKLLNEAEATELHRAGMELGSHSMSSPDLRRLDDESLERELRESAAAIERITGQPCRTLAYPYGFYDDRVMEVTERAGYELAFRWLPGPWTPLAAPRLPAPPRHGAGRLALKLLGIRRRKG